MTNRLPPTANGFTNQLITSTPFSSHYFAANKLDKVTTAAPEFDAVEKQTRERIERMLKLGGKRSPEQTRTEAREDLPRDARAPTAAGLTD